MEENAKQNMSAHGDEPEKDAVVSGAGEENLAKCESERQEYLDGWKRAKADFLNYQKDEGKRFEELMKFGTMEFIKDFIPVLDSFDLAIEMLEKEGKAERGLYMIRAQLLDMLKKHGLRAMRAEKGTLFDPGAHEALGDIESDAPSGTVAEEIERGYTLNGRVVRPARVKLSKQTMNNEQLTTNN